MNPALDKSFSAFVWMVLILFNAALPPAWAEEPAAAPETAETAPAVPEILNSPRATMRTFLHAMNDIKRGREARIEDAIKTLDLSKVNLLVHKERGRDLAWTLLEVLDHTEVVDPEQIPEEVPEGFYVFAEYKEGDTFVGDIRITRQEDGRWLFDADSLEKLEDILHSFGDQERVKQDAAGLETEQFRPWHLRIRDHVPESLQQRGLLLELWQWLGLLVIIVVGLVIDKILSGLLALLMRFGIARPGSAFSELEADMLRPFGLMAMAAVWWGGLNLLGLPTEALLILLLAAKFLASVAGVWAVYRLVDLIGAVMRQRAARTASRVDDMLVPLFTRTAKVFVTVFGVIFLADNMNVNITGLLAGVGLGGFALALAAKDALENFFGSLMVLMDRTFMVGDWVKIDNIEGTVETIGLRSTRIRTFYDSLITMPNSRLITAEVDNLGKRSYRRFNCMMSLTYDTPPARIEAFCEGVREIVRLHPYTRKDYFHVYLNQYAAASLDVMVYIFFAAPDWSTELRERHRFLLDVLRLAQKLEVEFAFPTQTMYLRKEETPQPPDPARDETVVVGKQEAEAIVKAHTGLGVKPPPVVF